MEHKGSKILETERLVLRPFRVSDAEAMFYGWATDREVTKYLTWTPHESIEVTRQFLAQREEEYKKPNVYHWAITLGGELIGDIELGEIDWRETGGSATAWRRSIGARGS